MKLQTSARERFKTIENKVGGHAFPMGRILIALSPHQLTYLFIIRTFLWKGKKKYNKLGPFNVARYTSRLLWVTARIFRNHLNITILVRLPPKSSSYDCYCRDFNSAFFYVTSMSLLSLVYAASHHP